MVTHSSKLIQNISDAISKAERAASGSHGSEALFQCFQSIGSTLEIFLKSHAFPGISSDANLYKLIEKIGDLGLSSSAKSILHRLRQDYYNKSKHEPNFSPSTWESLQFLSDVKLAIEEVASLNLGTSSSAANHVSKRLFWLGFWDHIVGGETEIAVALPIQTAWLPICVDMIYVDMNAWDKIKLELPEIGEFHRGENSMPKKMYNAWANEGDFLDAASFEGCYQTLIKTLSNHERREDLIPSLKRENQFDSMLAACAFATVQAAQQGVLDVESKADMATKIAETADIYYAAPASSPLVEKFASAFSDGVFILPSQERRLLSGPYWLPPEDFNLELSRGAKQIKEFRALINRDLRLILGLNI